MPARPRGTVPRAGLDLVRSLYEATAGREPLGPPLEGDLGVDVCVVGGGFTGISAALNLAERGHSVAVLEASKVGWGASGRNGGQCSVGFSRDNVVRVAREIGHVTAKELWDLSVEAVDTVRGRIRRHGIDCDFRDGHILAAVKGRHVDELKRYHEVLGRDLGFEAEFLDRDRIRETIASERYLAGLLDTRSGHLHPLRYLLGLARAAREAGARIHERTLVTGIGGGDSPLVRTKVGGVRCRKIVLACNAYLNDLEPGMRARIMPVGSYICATRPLEDGLAGSLVANGACVNDMCHVLDYYRVSADRRLLFGGRTNYSPNEPVDLAGAMRKRVARVFPQLADVEFDHAWGGHVAITRDRFPDLGWIGENILYAQGFSGHGVALSGFSGRLIAEAIDGDPSRFGKIAAHRARRIPGGELLRAPLMALALFWYVLRDRL